METSQSISNQHNVKQQCENTLRRSLSLFYYLQQWLSQQCLVIHHYVSQVVHAGRVAFNEYSANRRHLVGAGFGVAGIVSIFLHTAFPESSRDFTWYYINWFYFIEVLRLWLVICFFSVAFFLHVPTKFKSIWVVFALTFAVGLGGCIHYSFFVDSFESYHSFPVWEVVAISLALGAGFIKSIDYLCYRKYHLKDGTTCRIIGVIEMDMPWDKKEQILKELAQEYRDLNARI
jgi:hypothetical protein